MNTRFLGIKWLDWERDQRLRAQTVFPEVLSSIIHLPMAECIHTDIYPHPGMELLGHGVSICLSLRAIAKQFSKEARPIHTPTNVWKTQFSHGCVHLYYRYILKKYYLSVGWAVVSIYNSQISNDLLSFLSLSATWARSLWYICAYLLVYSFFSWFLSNIFLSMVIEGGGRRSMNLRQPVLHSNSRPTWAMEGDPT